jgi:hypothetical protein
MKIYNKIVIDFQGNVLEETTKVLLLSVKGLAEKLAFLRIWRLFTPTCLEVTQVILVLLHQLVLL